MKRNEFIKLAGIGLIGALISPSLMSKGQSSDCLDDIDIRELLAKGEPIIGKTFELHRELTFEKYPNFHIDKCVFKMIGKDSYISFGSNDNGYFCNNHIEHKKRFLFN